MDSSREQLLEVIEHQQHTSRVKMLTEQIDPGLLCGLRHAKSLSEKAGNESWIAQGGTIEETDAISKSLSKCRCHSQCQTGFANTSGSCEGEQADLAAQELLVDRAQLVFASDEWSWRER
ncbi:hypothetical protein KSF_005990 [Reticulibacter mediterranei]|uniref:Uncharacterized protein n=1 Tax=Reticulibacter mediterranei TaxID=2778369 RepID=A0A8J3I9T7_9CHLR|nr:hypothetical protein KSF_005990 [Reticulibacter mediterranei]